MAELEFPGKFAGVENILAAAQDLTALWADLGAEQAVAGAFSVTLWLQLDINGSTNARVRLLAKHEAAGALEYTLPIHSVAAAVDQIEPEYLEFNVDADQNMAISWQLDGGVPVVQFQVQAGAVGAPAGQILSAYVTTGVPG